MKKKLLKRDTGFTLIELVVVMAIIAVLAVLIIAAIQAARRASVETQNRGNAKTLETALEAYAASNNGAYPDIVAGTSIRVATQDGSLLRPATGRQYLTSQITGSCANGGGTVYSSASTSTFTIYVGSYTCTANSATNMLVITH